MKQLGYYAKDKNNNLHQFEWGADEEFSILNSDGDYVMRDPKEYEILEIGFFTADTVRTQTPKLKNSGYNSDEMYNCILVHVARTWERVRMNQIEHEMPLDNLESVDAIGQVATEIFEGKVIQGFVNGSDEVRMNDYWIKNTEEGMSDCFIEELADKLIVEGWIEPPKPKTKVRKWEQINDGVELNEAFLPNLDLTYTVEFDGVDKFRALLEQDNFDRKMVGVDKAPKTIYYKLNKPVEDFTAEERETILEYRGLKLSDGFGVDDIFIEKSNITLTGVPFIMEMNVECSTTFEGNETAEEFLERTGDIYLHGAGDQGHHDKDDLGGNHSIKFI